MSKIEKVISISLDDKTKTGLDKIEQTFKDVDSSIKKAEGTSVSLRRELKQLQNDLLSGKFTGEEFKKATERAGELKDTIGDLNSRIKTLGSDTRTLDGLVGAAEGIAGGFALAQGAAALFGDKNKDLEESLLKVQSAIAILNGFQAVANQLQKDSPGYILASTLAQRAYNLVIDESTGKLNLFKLALAGTGIGLIVLAIGALVANWDKLSEAIGGSTQKMKDLDSVSEATATSMESVYTNLFKVRTAFDEASKGAITKKEALKIYNETLGDTLGKAKTLEEAEKIYKEKTPDYIQASFLRAQALELINTAAKQAAENLTEKGQVQFSDYINNAIKTFKNLGETNKITEEVMSRNISYLEKLRILGEMGDKKVAQTGKEREAEDKKTIERKLKLAADLMSEADKLANKAKINLTGDKEDNKASEEAYQKLLDQTKDYLDKTTDAFDKQRETINKNDKLRAQDRLTFIKEITAKEKAFIIQNGEDIQKSLNAIAQKRLDAEQANKDKADAILKGIREGNETPAQKLEREYKENLKVLETANANTLTLTAKFITDKKALEDADKARRDADDETRKQKELADAQAVADAKLAIQNSYLDSLSGLAGIVGALAGKNKDLQRIALIAESAVGIAKIIINTQAANSAAVLKYSALPGGQALSAAEIVANKISAGIGIAANVVATSKALSAIGGGGSASSSAVGGTAPQAQFNIVGQGPANRLAGTIANQEQQPLRAYVVGSDITSQQSLDRNKINNSTFL